MIISVSQVNFLHELGILEHGGSAGVRDASIIESAVMQPCQTFDGVDLYPSLLEKVATLGFGIIRNHGYIDGNKRAGLSAMALVLHQEYGELEYNIDEAEAICLGVADSSVNREQLHSWLKKATASRGPINRSTRFD